MNQQSLHGQTVVVLGGSRGIGLEVARLAAGEGARVWVGARGEEALGDARRAVVGAECRRVDVTRENEVKAFFEEIAALSHLYLAAGSFVGGTALEGDLVAFRQAIEARIWGGLYAVRAAVPRMGSGGSITLTGGVSTDRPAKGAFISAVGTAAAEHMAKALALELGPIRVNAISPGWTDTPMWEPILGEQRLATFAAVGATLPVQRIATATEAAEAVLFLMKNGSVTGESLHVDGGHRLV